MIDFPAMNDLSVYTLLGYGAGFVNKIITSVVRNGHEYRTQIEKNKQINNRLSFKDVKDTRKYRFKFARRMIVITLFPLCVLSLLFASFFGIDTVIPVHETTSWFFGLFSHDTVVLKSAVGFFYDRASMAELSVMTVGMYMGQSGSQ